MSAQYKFVDFQPTSPGPAPDQTHVDIQEILLLVTRLHDGIEERVAAGIVRGVKQLLADPEFVEASSEKFAQRFFVASGKHASQWIGGRILTALAFAATGALVGWLVKTGKI